MKLKKDIEVKEEAKLDGIIEAEDGIKTEEKIETNV